MLEKLNRIQDSANLELDEKAKVLSWLILGSGIHGIPISSVRFLTEKRIIELYNVDKL